MTRSAILGSVVLAMLASDAFAQRRGGGGGVRGAVVGGMVGGSEGAATGAKIGVVTGPTRRHQSGNAIAYPVSDYH